jgi:tetratricopeptide (TPR) repeat protein
LNGFQEAEELCDKAISLGMVNADPHLYKYQLAAIRGDRAAMEKEIKWLAGQPRGYLGYFQQSDAAAFYGQLKQFQNLRREAANLAEQSGNVDTAAIYLASIARVEASFGYCGKVPESTAKALALSRTGAPNNSLWALSVCGRIDQARSLAEEWKKTINPHDTVDNKVTFPIAQALIQLQRKQFDKAIQMLQPVLQFERAEAAGFNAMFLRGQAYLGLGDGKAASAEFQKILDHRGLAPLDIRYPIAYLYLGRSAKLEGDLAKRSKAYQDFLALWKDADPDIPILKEANAEYEKLK